MDFTEQLRVLEAAHGHPAKLALATVDLAYPELTQAESDKLKEGLEAAAIPHWCDEEVLSALLDVSTEESEARLERLRGLKVLEPFRARGDNAVNVHEATRLALRKAMETDQQERFRALSKRAVALFANDLTPRGRIEWIYHLLCADPDRGATELEKISREWDRSASTEDFYALGAALRELEKTGALEGRARVWALLTIASIRRGRGEEAQMLSLATETLQLARAAADQLAESDAQCLVGDVLQAQGKLAEARAAFAESQAIIAELASQDPTNEDRQADLAVAHSRAGGVLEKQYKLAEAQEAFEKTVAICQSLLEQEPSNAGRRRDLAAASSRLGAVLLARHKLKEALAEFQEYLSITQQLVDLKPANVDWQQLLADAHRLIGEVLQAQGKLPEALAEFGKYQSISRHLVNLEPNNPRCQFDLGAAHSRIGDVLRAQGKSTEALAEFREYLSITQKLVELDPTNADWQAHLAAAHNLVDLLQGQT